MEFKSQLLSEPGAVYDTSLKYRIQNSIKHCSHLGELLIYVSLTRPQGTQIATQTLFCFCEDVFV